MTRNLRLLALLGLALSGTVTGCNDPLPGPGDGGATDAANSEDAAKKGDSGETEDMTLPPQGDMPAQPQPDLVAAGDLATVDLAPGPDLAGMAHKYGPGMGSTAFPHHTDKNPDPSQVDKNVDKDPNGYIGLTQTHSNFDFLWLAGDQDWNIGTVSKVDTKGVKEVARYFTVTCLSNPKGSRAACDGTNGCCSADDFTSYTNRTKNMPSGPHQSVQTKDNRPSRTTVDFNGDLWVANRAFGGQGSVTKVANDIGGCTDRNGTMGIQTSSDVNGDGVIDTDCNRNMVPDDLADVAKKACVNGKAQEFYGLDDECVLFTTNVNVPNMVGRPIALGKGTEDGTPSDAWAGCYNDAKFFRIDGATGLTKAQAVLPNPPMGQAGPKSNPYGAVIDAKGILWATNLGGGLRYFDTNQPAMAGAARDPKGYALGGYGITLDRDQNVWVAGYSGGVNATPNDAYRYTPDRTKPFATLGDGFWTRVNAPGAGSGAPASSSRGIASDSRTDKIYFVWMALTAGWVLRIDASTIAAPNGIDKTVDGTNMPAMKIAGDGTIGAGVDADQNVWGVSRTGSVATRIKVDINGKMTPPDILAGISGMGCPVGNGDRCSLVLNGTMSDPQPYTYSDFTGFGLKNFTLPKGSYQYTLKGCAMGKTTWGKIIYDVTLPPGTKVTVRARSGATAVPDNTWGAFTGEYLASPADLAQKPGPLVANPAPYLQVEFNLSTLDQAVSPKLKSFEATYSCL